MLTKGTIRKEQFLSYINGVCCLHGVDDLVNHNIVKKKLEVCIREAEHYFCNTFMFSLHSDSKYSIFRPSKVSTELPTTLTPM